MNIILDVASRLISYSNRKVRAYSLSANRGNNVLPPVNIMLLNKQKLQKIIQIMKCVFLKLMVSNLMKPPFIKYRMKIRMARINSSNNALS